MPVTDRLHSGPMTMLAPGEKGRSITEGLLRKTRAGKAKWKRIADRPGAFELPLSNSRVVVEFVSPATEVDRILLLFGNKNGELMGGWRVDEGEPHWELMYELFTAVQGQVGGWDKVLEDIEAYLHSE